MKTKPYYLKSVPPLIITIPLLLAFTAMSVIYYFFKMIFNIEIHDLMAFQTFWVFISTIGLATWRVTYFFPFPQSSYCKWLSNTPWNYKLPLPKGPILLTRSDIIMISFLCIFNYLSSAHWVIPALCFFGTYTLIVFLFTIGGFDEKKYWGKRITVALIAPLSFYPFYSLTSLAIVIGICYIICYFHLRDILKEYPWNLTQWLNEPEVDISSIARKSWPYGVLTSDKNEIKSSTEMFYIALAGSGFITWWMHAIFSSIQDNAGRNLIPLLFILLVIITFFSRFLFKHNAISPISFWGRISNGYYIIPRHDIVFIAPLIIVVIAVFSIIFFPQTKSVLIWWMDGSVFLLLLTAIGCPPSLQQWRYTGAFSIRRNKMEERQITLSVESKTKKKSFFS